MTTIDNRPVAHMTTEELEFEKDRIGTLLSAAFKEMGTACDISLLTVIDGDDATKAAKIKAYNDRITEVTDAWLARPVGRSITPENDDVRAAKAAVLAPEQKLTEWLPRTRGGPLSLTKYLRGLGTGKWDGADAELKAMSEGVLAGGGYMVPEMLSARVIDRARSAATVFRAGAQTVPMTSSTLRIARVAGDPTAAWKAENAVGTASDATLEGVDFTARTLFAIVKMSVELADDSPNAEAVVMDTLAKALALELDRVVLRGSGTAPEPEGIRNVTGMDVISLGTNGAALTDYADFSQAVENIQTANHEGPYSVIYAPRTAGTLDRLVDTTGQPLRPPPSFEALRKFASTQVPIDLTQGSAENASDAYVGDFRNVMVGMRTALQLDVSRVGDAFDAYQLHVRAVLRADVQLVHDDAFTVITGIIPAA